MRKLVLIAGILVLLFGVGEQPNAQVSIEEQFETKYKAWKEYISRPEVMVRSDTGPRFDCPQFQAIVRLGLPVLPYIVRETQRNPDERFLWKAFEEIAKVRIRAKYDREEKKIVFPDFPNLEPDEQVYLYWWKEGHRLTPVRFETLYVERRQLKQRGEDEEAGAVYQRMIDLGLAALPSMMKKIEEGDSALVAAVSYLTDGAIDYDATPQRCVEWWRRNENEWTIPFDSGVEPDTTEQKGNRR